MLLGRRGGAAVVSAVVVTPRPHESGPGPRGRGVEPGNLPKRKFGRALLSKTFKHEDKR